ncbi:hypothetical protein CJU90_3653 [Yarrowia sp. C11]|nr:hypothetical protein CJU90_3653 [Yarrowia sp. C11]
MTASTATSPIKEVPKCPSPSPERRRFVELNSDKPEGRRRSFKLDLTPEEVGTIYQRGGSKRVSFSNQQNHCQEIARAFCDELLKRMEESNYCTTTLIDIIKGDTNSKGPRVPLDVEEQWLADIKMQLDEGKNVSYFDIIQLARGYLKSKGDEEPLSPLWGFTFAARHKLRLGSKTVEQVADLSANLDNLKLSDKETQVDKATQTDEEQSETDITEVVVDSEEPKESETSEVDKSETAKVDEKTETETKTETAEVVEKSETEKSE